MPLYAYEQGAGFHYYADLLITQRAKNFFSFISFHFSFV